MVINGFRLALKADGSEVERWRNVPFRIEKRNGDKILLRVDGAVDGWQNDEYRIEAATWTEPDPPIDPDADRQSQIRSAPDRVDLLTRLKAASPSQIDGWIDTNVTTVATARTVFKAILKLIALDQR